MFQIDVLYGAKTQIAFALDVYLTGSLQYRLADILNYSLDHIHYLKR